MKKTFLMASLIAAAGFSATASAHVYNGTLGTAAAATDKFYITCATGAAKITYRVKRNAGTGNVTAKAYSPVGALATSNATAYGNLVTVKTGAGAKFFEVKKSPAVSGGRGYSLDMHCYDANNLHEPEDQPTAVTYIQNQ